MTESFDWNLPGLNRTHFNALANLLSLRNGGQVEAASFADIQLDHSHDDCETTSLSSFDTRYAQQISDSGHDALKKKFLDCLAEFAANKRSGKAVACTAMEEAEDEVTVFIARNEGFISEDEFVFAKLSDLLGNFSSSDGAQTFEDLLWKEMLSYHQERIQHSYIPDLRASFKDHDTTDYRTVDKNVTDPEDILSLLRKLVFDSSKSPQIATDIHSKLVMAAYEVRTTQRIEVVLQSSPDTTTKSKKLWVDICLLARLRISFQKFKEIALKLPSFNRVTIVLVPRNAILVNPPERPLTLKQLFHLLDLALDSATIKSVLGQKWSVARSEQEFSKRQKQKLNIHAEVQMLLFLNNNELSTHNLFPYFGCSKLCCFMCANFLESYGEFTTRGSHGRLFKPWTVPETARLGVGQANRIAGALMQLQNILERELGSSIKENLPHAKTSVIGGDSIFSSHQAESSQRQLNIDRLNMKAEQARIADLFKRKSLEENHLASRMTPLSTSSKDIHDNHHEWDGLDYCSICSTPTSRKCSVCGKDFYCSQDCEDKRSGYHIFKCTKRPLTSADYLYRCMREDLLPEDEDVLEDFGFNHLTSFADRSKLAGLYQGIFSLSKGVSVEDLHKWQVEGTLVANIKEFYYKIPERNRGGYFPWFLNHTHILEKRLTHQEATQNMIAKFFDEAKLYLDPEDQHKTPQDLKPEAKAHCYILLAAALHAASPNPVEQNWFSFGFCTCRGEGEESQLGVLYQRLLIGDKLYEDLKVNGVPIMQTLPRRLRAKTATFKEFWLAFQSGTLIQLMDSKGLKDERLRFPFLEEFLSSPYMHPSVWSLKQYLEVNDPGNYPLHPAVNVDYGFANCQTFEETCILMELYKRLLRVAHPLEVHKACLAGKLFEFAQMFHKMDKDHERLMKNMYPLEEIKTKGAWQTAKDIIYGMWNYMASSQ